VSWTNIGTTAAILAAFLLFAADANSQTKSIPRPPWPLTLMSTQPTHTFPCVPGGSTASLQACTLASSFSFSGSQLVIPGLNGAAGSLTTNITGSTQCIHADTSGVLSGTGTDCGAGGGGGSGTVNAGVAGKLAYYPSSATAVDDNANATMTNGVLALGTSASVLGGLDLFGNTSGTVSIRPQAAAGTYNFNLPTTAGASGQPMLSGGGGGSPMSFGTLTTGGGGTGGTSFTANALLKGAGASPFASSSIVDNGSIVTTPQPFSTQSAPIITEILNDATVATVVNKLAKASGAPSRATIATTSDTGGNIIGVVWGNAGTAGSAQIAVGGQVQCVFDGATVSNHFVQASTTAGGSCHDAGAGYPNNGQQVLGLVLSTNAASGTYDMKVFPPGIVPTGGASTGGDNSWTNRNRVPTALLTDAASITVDLAGPNVRTITLSGNRTLANPINRLSGELITFFIQQDNVGGRTLSVDSTYMFPNGDPPTFSTLPGARDMFTCWFGVNYNSCSAVAQNVKQVRLNAFDATKTAGGALTFSNNNLTATNGTANSSIAVGTLFRSAGKFAFRVKLNACASSGSCGVGASSSANGSTSNVYLGSNTTSVSIYNDGVILVNNVNLGSIGFTFTTGDYIDVVIDLTAHTIQAAKNGGALSSSASIGSMSTFNLSPACSLNASADSCTYDGSPSIAYSGATNWQ
jgi:hypothetical protein